MKTDENKGKFIVLAGCEGAGKSKQLEILMGKYPNAIFTREPGGTPYAEEGPRYTVLKSKFAKDLNGYEQMCEIFSGRSHHQRKVIVPAIERGQIVFSDRYDCCSFAYQIFGMNDSDNTLFGTFDSLRMTMPIRKLPDLYIILDVSPEVGMARVKKRKEEGGEFNYFDERGPEFHARVREGYKRFTELHTNRVVTIDAHQSIEKVAEAIDNALKIVLK